MMMRNRRTEGGMCTFGTIINWLRFETEFWNLDISYNLRLMQRSGMGSMGILFLVYD